MESYLGDVSHIPTLIENLDLDDERSQEIATVSYIFPELTLLGPHSFYMLIPTSPIPPLSVTFSDDSTSTITRTLNHLPPLKLTISLPESYPLESPPNIRLESGWVAKDVLVRLQGELSKLWEEMRDQVLYAVIDHLTQAAEVAFQKKIGAESLILSKSLEEELISFNKKTLKEVFEKGTYACGVCLEPKKGIACHRLFPCNHVFCIACLTDYYTTSITEGDVSNIKCLDPSCILNKKSKHIPAPDPPPQTEQAAGTEDTPPAPQTTIPPTLPPEELEDLGLSAELVTRYRMLKRKEALNADPKTIYCPRIWCQAPSRSALAYMDKKISTKGFYLTEKYLELKRAELSGQTVHTMVVVTPESPSDSPTDRLDVCSSCAYSFCKICQKGWHGEFVICRPKNAAKTAEELATEEYLNSAASQCPSCGSHVIKSYGCNHMICRCSTHFCFLCGAYLLADSPYIHFNTKENTRCYQRLWEGEAGDGMAGRGVRPPNPVHDVDLDDDNNYVVNLFDEENLIV